jgi:hypothetical protein
MLVTDPIRTFLLHTSLRRLHSKLEALDFEVEHAAEEELFQSQAEAEGSYVEDD